MPKRIFRIDELNLEGKLVLMRLDFNVPLGEPDENENCKIEDDTRIREALPTIQYAMEKRAKVILCSHLGRPKGERNEKYSLYPVANYLAEHLKTDVKFADDCVGDGIKLLTKGLQNGQVLLLENLRFHKEEEENHIGFSKKLASLCDLYINDAFGTAHRKHASTYGVPSITPKRAMGFLIEKELKALDQLLKTPKRPFYCILGGSKVTDKLKTIESLFRVSDALFIGGAMAHAFWMAEGKSIPEGAKKPSEEDIQAAKNLIKKAREKELPLYTPLDTNAGFDIGEKTISFFTEKLQNAQMIFWNGPLGWFEKEPYEKGTFEVAKAIAKLSAYKVVGGGDTVSAIHQAGVSSHFQHLSTGGGATLEYLEGSSLPGIDILVTDSIRALEEGIEIDEEA